MMTIWNYLKQNKVLAAILGITLLGIVLYANTLNNQMFWDDNDFILNNQYVHNWKNIPQYFSENLIAGVGLVSDYWRPVLLMVFSAARPVSKTQTVIVNHPIFPDSPASD